MAQSLRIARKRYKESFKSLGAIFVISAVITAVVLVSLEFIDKYMFAKKK